jgi:hypothetical protein
MALALKRLQHHNQPASTKQESAAEALEKALGTGESQEQRALQKFQFALFTQDSDGNSQNTFHLLLPHSLIIQSRRKPFRAKCCHTTYFKDFFL